MQILNYNKLAKRFYFQLIFMLTENQKEIFEHYTHTSKNKDFFPKRSKCKRDNQ